MEHYDNLWQWAIHGGLLLGITIGWVTGMVTCILIVNYPHK